MSSEQNQPRRGTRDVSETASAEVLPVSSLHRVDENSLDSMCAGDILLLAEASTLRRNAEIILFAVLACPACGNLLSITPSQYFGTFPVVCSADECCYRFRIEDEARLISVPVV
jgi:hypothetical protein